MMTSIPCSIDGAIALLNSSVVRFELLRLP